MMIRIALVEDEPAAAATVKEYLERYEAENPVKFSLTHFANPILLLENYSANYHIVFMDIRMPHMNGMDAARRLRALDGQVTLIFLTSLAQYALVGYEVEALDYIVKPVNYYDFALKLARAVDKLSAAHPPHWITLSTEEGRVRLAPEDVRYIETDGHHVIFHTLSGDYRQYSSLSSLEEELASHGFARCNSCYLVNLRYVKGVKGYTVLLDNCQLKISQPRKKRFLNQLEQQKQLI